MGFAATKGLSHLGKMLGVMSQGNIPRLKCSCALKRRCGLLKVNSHGPEMNS